MYDLYKVKRYLYDFFAKNNIIKKNKWHFKQMYDILKQMDQAFFSRKGDSVCVQK